MNQENQNKNSFIPHLIELRNRLSKILLFILIIFIFLIPFSGEIYNTLSSPLLNALPEGSDMIAIDVASPFLIPFKLVIYLSIFITIPYILYHLWSFIAPGLYNHEKTCIPLNCLKQHIILPRSKFCILCCLSIDLCFLYSNRSYGCRYYD